MSIRTKPLFSLKCFSLSLPMEKLSLHFFALNCIVLEKVLKVTSKKGDNKSNNFQKILLIQNKKILDTPILHHPLLQERILKKLNCIDLCHTFIFCGTGSSSLTISELTPLFASIDNASISVATSSSLQLKNTYLLNNSRQNENICLN